MKLQHPNSKNSVSTSIFCALVILLIPFVYANAQAPGGVSSGLNLWLKAGSGTSSSSDGSYLDFWNDQSTNSNNATQSMAAAKPQYFGNAINGNAVVRTASQRYFNVNLNGIDNKNYTVFTVTKRLSGGSFQHIIGVQQSGNFIGLGLGYDGSSIIRHTQYGNAAALACLPFAGANEIPTMLSAQFDTLAGKKVWQIRDGIQLSRFNSNKTHYAMTGNGRIGRAAGNYGFSGWIAEVIVYDRVLSSLEKQKVHTYLSVKYGLCVPLSEHLYYNEPSYVNDIFGIGKDMVGQGLNQATSNSINPDDILEIQSPSSLDDGDYMICGNNGFATSFSAYSGLNCALTQILARHWKVRTTGSPGTVTARFDLTGITGFTSDKLLLLIDSDGDGFEDETFITGNYSAPYFDITNVTIPDGAIVTIGTGEQTWYAVASGNTSGVIWSATPNGTPQSISSFCANTNLVVNTGVTITNDWASFSCNDFNVKIGAIWNASTGIMNVSGAYTIDGTFNAQSSTVGMVGRVLQNIKGEGIANIYNLNVSNASGVNIQVASGGVRVRNLLNITSGTLTTNSGLTLISDLSSTGMIASLATGAVSGEVYIQRYHNATAQGWVNLSCPVQGRTLVDWNDDLITTGFAGSDYPPPYSFNNIQYYNETVAGSINSGYVGMTNITNPIGSGRGYLVFMNAGVMNLDVVGSIYSGDQILPVTYTNSGNPAGDGWNLLGNPYPCTIDWNSTSWTKTNMSNAVYVWNAATGQYASYVNGAATNGGSRYIPSSQSFFVTANAINPSLTLRENCKATVQGTFRSTETTEAVFTLRIENDLYSDETSLARNEHGTLAFEHEIDAYKLRSPLSEVPYLATISAGGEDLSINTFSDLTEETIIPLRIEVGASGQYTISHKGLISFANGACLILEDMLTGELYPLNQFDDILFDLQAGNDDLRFQLRIGGTSISNITSAGCPGVENGTATIEVGNDGPSNITWMNGEGEILLTTNAVVTSTQITHLAPGTYFAVIDQNGGCGTTEAEFVVKEDEPIITAAIISPTRCPNEDDGGIALNILGGTAPYEITWSDGSIESVLENVGTGNYTAFITDAKGCFSTFAFEVPANSNLVSDFETIQDTYEMMNGSVIVDFYNTSENATHYTWSFDDVTINSNESNPSHLFSKIGIYEVKLRAINDDCEALTTKSIKITNPKDDGSGLGSEIIGTLTDNGVQIMFFFDQPRQLQISAYNVLGQQLIEPIRGIYERQTITFSDRRYAANALIEVVDMKTGERALLRMGI